ncbi:hypothetical protein J2Y38_000451 [Flavobacterium sp. 2755]|uniref:hypothetical protein n=1 Tax=Flavobacterium sp. 2755 TaxID=2817765 RepID=UPI002862366D|nr:hypothetical protein [Flavobacterium sp. 2755]MDR6760272.1 hypothetical protein [Flavobacterium sp. 2755]
MAKTTPELVEEILSNYKENMSWILLAFALLSTLVSTTLQYFQNWKLSQKVEAYKNQLAKSEIKFTRHTELQIETLKQLYDLVVKIHFSFTELKTPMDKTHEALHKNMKTFQAVCYETAIYVHRNKILLTDDIMAQFRVFHNKYREIEKLCILESEELVRIEDINGSFDPQILYGSQERENEYINSRLQILNDNSDVSTFEDDILKLRELIENYFKKLVA